MKKKLVTALSTALCGMSAIGAIGAGTAVIGTPNVMAAETTSVMINSKTFPDKGFRQYVNDIININGDNKLSASEIKNVTEIDLITDPYFAGTTARNLTGIEVFYNLKTLICMYEEQILSVDYSKNKNITEAYIGSLDKAKKYYKDVNNPHVYYFKPVMWAGWAGVDEEYGNYYFYPNKQSTREEVADYLWYLAGEPNPKSTKSVFSDVTNKSEYYKAILWANEKGIITGTNGKFTPTGICTREQIVTMLWRFAGKPNPKSMKSKFTDVTDTKRYSYKAIMWASENGITTGTNGKFSPTGKCKKCDTVTFLYRYAQKFNK